jgi:hypothetical protein
MKRCDVGFWHETAMPTCPRDVCLRGDRTRRREIATSANDPTTVVMVAVE